MRPRDLDSLLRSTRSERRNSTSFQTLRDSHASPRRKRRPSSTDRGIHDIDESCAQSFLAAAKPPPSSNVDVAFWSNTPGPTVARSSLKFNILDIFGAPDPSDSTSCFFCGLHHLCGVWSPRAETWRTTSFLALGLLHIAPRTTICFFQKQSDQNPVQNPLRCAPCLRMRSA
jgi:hypothetical protein